MRKKKSTLYTDTTSYLEEINMLSVHLVYSIQDMFQKGMSIRHISRELGVCRQTVRRYKDGLPEQQKHPGRPISASKRFLLRNRTNILQLFQRVELRTPVALQRIQEEYGVVIHPKMFNRFMREYRHIQIINKIPVTSRFETQPGDQMQIDFGEKDIVIAGQTLRVHFFVGILGYSRRIFVKAYEHESQNTWLNGIESAFQYFGGIPRTIVSDNARSLVAKRTHGCAPEYTGAYEDLCQYYGVRPVATAVRKPRSKGKVERAVQYVKHNALVDIELPSLDALNARLEQWCRTVADKRILSQFKESPARRFQKERTALRTLVKAPLYAQICVKRKVDKNGFIRLENKHYRVPDDYRLREVQIIICGNNLSVQYGDTTVIQLDKAQGVSWHREQPLSREKSDSYFAKKMLEYQKNKEYNRYQQSPNAIGRSTTSYNLIFVGGSL